MCVFILIFDFSPSPSGSMLKMMMSIVSLVLAAMPIASLILAAKCKNAMVRFLFRRTIYSTDGHYLPRDRRWPVTTTQINVTCEMWKKKQTCKTEVWWILSLMNFIFKPFESIQFTTPCVLVQTGVGQNAKASTHILEINSICWWDCIDEYLRPVSPVIQNMTIAKNWYC